MKEVSIRSTPESLEATVFESDQENTVVIISSATGVKQEYYQKIAQFLSKEGITVITFDYQGIGRSLKKPIKSLQHNASDWARVDLESVIQYVQATYPNSKKVILGHSIGGQLVGMAKSSKQMDKLILVAAQSGYWKYWSGTGRAKMWFNWHILFPSLLRVFGYLPAKKVSSMEDLPKNVANQWRTWGKHKDYIFSDKTLQDTYYHELTMPLTAFSIDDDEYAPKAAVEWMIAQYGNAKKKSIHLVPSELAVKKIGHFGVFKEKFAPTIWQQILSEIKEETPE